MLNQGLHLEESCSPNLLANQPDKMGRAGSYDSQPFIKHSITATISPSHFLIYITAFPKHIHSFGGITSRLSLAKAQQEMITSLAQSKVRTSKESVFDS